MLPRGRAATPRLIALLIAALVAAAPARAADRPDARLFPPWQHGANNDAVDRGLAFTVPDADDMADFHGDPADPKLVLYVGGNYFFAMAPLVQAFEAANPAYNGRLFWETLPPGRLAEQLKTGGRITVGNMIFTARADVYLAGLAKVRELVAAGQLEAPVVPYVTSTLAIMPPKGNPAHVAGLADLGRPGIRLAMPNPSFEGIARQIKAALAKAGGSALASAVYEAKVKDGTTILTEIHHRQTPLFLMLGLCRSRRHLALRGRVPGTGGPSDHTCRHPGRAERARHLRRRHGRRRRASRCRARVARFHLLTDRAGDLPKVWV